MLSIPLASRTIQYHLRPTASSRPRNIVATTNTRMSSLSYPDKTVKSPSSTSMSSIASASATNCNLEISFPYCGAKTTIDTEYKTVSDNGHWTPKRPRKDSRELLYTIVDESYDGVSGQARPSQWEVVLDGIDRCCYEGDSDDDLIGLAFIAEDE